MVLRKLIISISLSVTGGLLSTGFAYADPDQDMSNPAWALWSQPQWSQSSADYPASYSQFIPDQKWLNDKWSGQSSLHQTNGFDKGRNGSSQWTMDIKRLLLSATENTYLAMGLGWNDLTVTNGESSSGMRFVAEGRVGIFGPAYLFGQAALSPWMSDLGNNIDPYGKELELGLAVDPVPSLSFRAGYRSYWLDSADSSADPSIRRHTDGFYLGGGVHW